MSYPQPDGRCALFPPMFPYAVPLRGQLSHKGSGRHILLSAQYSQLVAALHKPFSTCRLIKKKLHHKLEPAKNAVIFFSSNFNHCVKKNTCFPLDANLVFVFDKAVLQRCGEKKRAKQQ